MKYCTHCGKELLDEAVICLNCGCQTTGSRSLGISAKTETPVVVAETESDLAMWSKICGIVSFFIGWFALGITAIVLANMSKDETNGVMSPSAKVGYTCGMIATIVTSILFVVLIAVLVSLSI